MSFPYPINVNVPNAPNQPRNDQGPMKTNFNNINGFLGVDHVSPGTNPGAGFHQQVTYFQQNIPGAQTNPRSVGFTSLASALGGNAPQSTAVVVDQFYRNQNGTFQTLPIKAWAQFSTPATMSNSFNVSSVTRNVGPIRYVVVLATNATYSANYAVICNAQGSTASIVSTYTISNTTTFTLYFFNNTNNAIDPLGFSFLVLQV